MTIENEKAIREVVRSFTETYASDFSNRHISDVANKEGTINMKIHNVFIAALGADIQYYSALARSLDSSLGNMLEQMAIDIASLNYKVSRYVEGDIYSEQTEYIATLLDEYKRHKRKPQVLDYNIISSLHSNSSIIYRRHENAYYLYDCETSIHHLIELKIGGDLDNKKAQAEKEALLEQYCILVNKLGKQDDVKVWFATAYNRFGEGRPWNQSRVRQFFADEELLISSAFWNMVCKSDQGYDIVLDEYRNCAHYIVAALAKIKNVYLPDKA